MEFLRRGSIGAVMKMARDFGGILKCVSKYKYLILVVLVGIVLILLPAGGERRVAETGAAPTIETPYFSLSDCAKRPPGKAVSI